MTHLERQRDGELIEVEDDQLHRCIDGLIVDPLTDQPKPCPICRPELAARIARQRRTDWTRPKGA